MAAEATGWSCPPATALDYPARYLFTFLDHHGMLTVFGSPTWRTVTGGSARYVEAITARLTQSFGNSHPNSRNRMLQTLRDWERIARKNRK